MRETEKIEEKREIVDKLRKEEKGWEEGIKKKEKESK